MKGHQSLLRRGRFSETGQVYHVTLVSRDRRPVFADFCAARHVIREIAHLNDKDWLDSLTWVLMPDHLHWLFALGASRSLSATIRRFKSSTGFRLRHLSTDGKGLWQRGFYDHALRQEENLVVAARYIVSNPLRAGLVTSVADYPHWDSVWLP